MRAKLTAKPAVWTFLICVSLFSAILLVIPGKSYAGARYADGLEKAVASAQPGEKIPVLVQFYGAISRAEFHQALEGLTGDERREAGIELLRSNLFKQAGNAIAWIENEEAEGRAFAAYSFWLGNGYVMSLQADRIALLAEFPEVESIVYTPPRPIPEIDEGDPWTDPGEVELDDLVWGVEDIQTRDMWAEGYTGEGILLAIIDTGCLLTHPDLADHIWNNANEIPDNGLDDDDNEYVDDIHGWNFVDDDNDVMDVHGHGTKVAGVLVGDGAMGDTTGVAPGAEIIVIRNYGLGHTSENFHSLAVQYAVGVGADFISCSMSYEHEGNEMDVSIRQTMELVAELEIIQTNSMGNKGAFSGNLYNVNLPGRCPPPWLHPDQDVRGGASAILGIGYYERSGANRVIGEHSTEGPAVWQEETFPLEYQDYPYIAGGLLKPDIVAPGNVTSTKWNPTPNSYYTNFTAESSATPHVAGALALLKQAHPDASIVDLVRALKMSALDRGDHGHDNIWGAGMLRIHDAHEYLTMMENMGTLRLISLDQAGRILDNVYYTISDSTGFYMSRVVAYTELPAGAYTLNLHKYGYDDITNVQAIVSPNDTTNYRVRFNKIEFPNSITLSPSNTTHVDVGLADTVAQVFTITNESGEAITVTGSIYDYNFGYSFAAQGIQRFQFDLSSATVRGLGFVDTTYYILGQRDEQDATPMMWHADSAGNLIDSVAQADDFGENGLGDLAITHDNLIFAAPYSGDNADIIYTLGPDWSILNSMTSPVAPVRGLAVDEEEGVLYVREADGTIHKTTMNGILLSTYAAPYLFGEEGSLFYYADGKTGPELIVISGEQDGDLYIEILHLSTNEFELITSVPGNNYNPVFTNEPIRYASYEIGLLGIVNAGIHRFALNKGEHAVSIPNPITVEPGASVDVEFEFYSEWWRIPNWNEFQKVVFADGPRALLGEIYIDVTGVDDEPSQAIPFTTELHPGYPNPFNPVTMLKYSLAQPGEVRIAVYNVLGQQVDVLYQGYHVAGTHQVSFDASDLASGLYLVQMETAGHQYLQKVFLLK